MKLLSLDLQGRYKSLKNQVFDFDDAQGNIVAFIGLNGSGKSQLLELIAEIFGYLERYLRREFKVRNWFSSLRIELKYSNQVYDTEQKTFLYSVLIEENGQVCIYCNGELLSLDYLKGEEVEEKILPSQIIGYSSGLNENLQRAFMKNAVQYLDVMNVRRAWELRLSSINEAKNIKGKYLEESDFSFFERQFSDAYSYYQKRHPALFHLLPKHSSVLDSLDIGLRPTSLPRLKYFDQDTTALMLASIGMMANSEQQALWKGNQRFNRIHSVHFRYDLREFTHDSGALLDVAKLLQSVGGVDSKNFRPLPKVSKTSEEFYNQFELDYLAGDIFVDYSDDQVKSTLLSSFFTSQVLFEKLYRLQLLGAKFWLTETKRQLRLDDFDRSVRKPQKWKSPIQILSLKLTDGSQSIEFDDFSDGEAQLVQMLSMVYIYRDSRALFLLDEPETHLNPFWRTHFHSYIEDIVDASNDTVQLFISTHSPFMISSLKRSNVFQFRRNSDGLINMCVAQDETYGTSFDVLIKDLFELRSLISQTVVDEIRVQLEQGNESAKGWIEKNLGLSAEKAYLIKRLSR